MMPPPNSMPPSMWPVKKTRSGIDDMKAGHGPIQLLAKMKPERLSIQMARPASSTTLESASQFSSTATVLCRASISSASDDRFRAEEEEENGEERLLWSGLPTLVVCMLLVIDDDNEGDEGANAELDATRAAAATNDVLRTIFYLLQCNDVMQGAMPASCSPTC